MAPDDASETPPQTASLAARMRDAKLRDASQAPSDAIERARRAKEEVAQAVLVPDLPADEPPREKPGGRRLSERLRREDEAQGADGTAKPKRRRGTGNLGASAPVLPTSTVAPAMQPADERSRLLRWFTGREAQQIVQEPITPKVALDEDEWEPLEDYAIEDGFSYVRIARHRTTGEVRYQVLEPPLTPDQKQIVAFVQDALIRGLHAQHASMSNEQREEYLLAAIRQILFDYRVRIDNVGQARVEYYLRRDFLGLGPIHVLMVDPNIEDISCDGAGEGLFLFHRTYESIQSNIVFADDTEVDRFVIRLAQRSGKAITISDPILDAALPDGSRLQATLGHEVTQNGSTFTIRRFRPNPLTPVDLLRFGTMSVDMMAWFWLVVQSGHSLVFSGGTASGKTTALNAVSQFIPSNAKVVSIEDTREVNLPHKNWIRAVTRTGSTSEGTGEIGMFELLKASLRQRPEYILVGEVRGIEATVAFQAMATGHTVYSTIHADSARSVVYRLENDPINIPRLVLQALDVIAIQAQVRVGNKRVRRVKEVVEMVGMDPVTKELLTNTVFRWDPRTDTFVYGGRSYLFERIATARNWSPAAMDKEYRRRARVLRYLLDHGTPSVNEITEMIRAYERDPQAVMQQVEARA